jgi:hypothetical protein
MQLELTGEDAAVLYDLLNAYLPELRWEVARTEHREFRHTMELRQDLVERLLVQLTESGAKPGAVTENPLIAVPTR